MDEISALKSNDNSWPPEDYVPMIICNPKEAKADTPFRSIVHTFGRPVGNLIKYDFHQQKKP